MQTIRVQNFQSLDDVMLELGNFTTVEGDSRAGKSALVRCLRVWAYNAKSVGAFVRHGEDAFTATVQINGHEIVCRRGEGITEYQLDGEPFEKIGFSVPEAVAEATGFRAIRYDRDLVLPLQIQGQFDAPFLLGEQWTGPAITKVLGSVSRINVIYGAQRLSRKRQRRVQQSISDTRDQVAQLEEQLTQYKGVDEQLALVAMADDQVTEALNAGMRYDELARAAEARDEAQARLDALVEPTSRPSEAWRHARETRSSLTKWLELCDLQEDMADAQTVLSGIEEPTTNPVAARKQVDVFRAELQVLKKLTNMRDDFVGATQVIAAEVSALGRAKARLAQATQAKMTFLEELGTCPLCGQITRGKVGG